LTINTPTTYGVGLFGAVDGAILKNIVLVNASITGGGQVGAIAGNVRNAKTTNNVTIENCDVTGTVTGSLYVGGIVGIVNPQNSNPVIIEKVVSNVLVEASGTASGNSFGGVVGYHNNYALKISESAFIGEVNAPARVNVGGMVGYAVGEATIQNSFVWGSLNGSTRIGGLIGNYKATPTFLYSYFSGTINENGTERNGLAASGYYNYSSYFDSSKTGLTTPTAQARTSQELYQKSTYTGWNFQTIWNIEDGRDYPYLRRLSVVPPLKPLDAVTGLKYTQRTMYSVTLAWDSMPGVSNYEVKYGNQTLQATTNSITVTELLPQTQYTFTVRSKTAENVGNWSKAVTVATLRGDSSLNGQIVLNIQNTKTYEVVVSANYLEFSPDATFTLTYNPSELTLLDFASHIGGNNTAPGKIAGTDIEILSASSGVIEFKLDKQAQDNKVWSGIITFAKFKALSTGTATILLEQ